MDITSLTKMLVENRHLRTELEIQQYEQAISSILNMNRIEHIRHLCLGFDDETERDDVMFGLIHAIESYDKNFGAHEPLVKLAESLNAMLPHAREWVKTLHKRILNHEPSRKIYADVISGVDVGTKQIVVEIMNEIKNKNPMKFEATASEFLTSIKH